MKRNWKKDLFSDVRSARITLELAVALGIVVMCVYLTVKHRW